MVQHLAFLSPEDTAIEIIESLGSIGKWLQAIGLFALIWIIFQIINFAYNRRRIKRLDKLEEKLTRIETKLNKITRKR